MKTEWKQMNVTNVTATKVDELNKKTTVLTDYRTATACYYSLSETENLPHFINVKKAFYHTNYAVHTL